MSEPAPLPMGSLPEYAYKLPHSFAQLARWRLENLARAVPDTAAKEAEDSAKQRLGKLDEHWIKLACVSPPSR
jgi:hypothetical protein